jgi:type II secretory pathway component PulF
LALTLPAPTLFVMGISDVFVKWWWLIFGVTGRWLLLLHAGLEAQRKDAACSWTVMHAAHCPSSVTLVEQILP